MIVKKKRKKEKKSITLLRKLLYSLDNNEWKDGKVMKEVREFLLKKAIDDFCDKKGW